jgi:Holliday junction DNA helicase RuvA
LSGDELASAVERDDVATLTRLPGIGKKTAERLIVELRGRMSSSGTSTVNHAASPIEEAVLGLIALGYKETEARKAIGRLPNDSEATPENLIRASLKQMLRQP